MHDEKVGDQFNNTKIAYPVADYRLRDTRLNQSSTAWLLCQETPPRALSHASLPAFGEKYWVTETVN